MGFTLEGYKYITINHFDQNLGKTLNLSSEIERFCLRWLNIREIDAAFSIPITLFSNLNKNRLSQHFEIIDPISSESRILLIFIFDFERIIARSKNYLQSKSM